MVRFRITDAAAAVLGPEVLAILAEGDDALGQEARRHRAAAAEPEPTVLRVASERLDQPRALP